MNGANALRVKMSDHLHLLKLQIFKWNLATRAIVRYKAKLLLTYFHLCRLNRLCRNSIHTDYRWLTPHCHCWLA